MWTILVALAAASAVQAGSLVAPLRDEAPSGGLEATPGQFPYQVGINVQLPDISMTFCGGSIIDEHVILTSASCVADGVQFEVIAGAHSIKDQYENSQQNFFSHVKLVHEKYNAEDGSNDIALVYLRAALEYDDHVKPIRLPSSDLATKWWNGWKLWWKPAVVSGWGLDSKHSAKPTLHYSNTRVVANLYCKLRRGLKAVQKTNICVSSKQTGPTCEAIDLGGPLVIEDSDGEPTQVGIVPATLADGCADVTKPQVFTRVTAYLDWIEEGVEKIKHMG